MSNYNPSLDMLWYTQPHFCAYCKRPLRRKPHRPDSATADHIVSRFNGGDGDQANLALVCRECNELKASHSLQQLERRLRVAEHYRRAEARRLRLIVEALLGMEKGGT